MQALSITRNLYRQFIIYGLVALVFAGLNTAKAEPIKMLALGDSLTAGYGLGPSEGLTAQLQAQLDKLYGDDQILVINAGVSGDTTRGGLARLDWALADNPDVVMVALGGNDMLRGLEPSESMENLKIFYQNCKRLVSQLCLLACWRHQIWVRVIRKNLMLYIPHWQMILMLSSIHFF